MSYVQNCSKLKDSYAKCILAEECCILNASNRLSVTAMVNTTGVGGACQD